MMRFEFLNVSDCMHASRRRQRSVQFQLDQSHVLWLKAHRGAAGTPPSGGLAGPQGRAAAVDGPAVHRHPLDVIKHYPLTDPAEVGRHHESAVDPDDDLAALARAIEGDLTNQEGSSRHVDGRRPRRATCCLPCTEQGFGRVRPAIGLGAVLGDVVHFIGG